MASPDPFSILQQGAENTSRYFNQLQTGLLRTREFQVQQEQQAFQNDLALKGLALKEKEMAFDHALATQKMSMMSQNMNFDAALTAAKVQSEEARAGYWNAKALETSAVEQAGMIVTPPIGGSPSDYDQWDAALGVETGRVMETYPAPLREAVSAMEQQGGDGLPTDPSAPSATSLFDWTDVGRGVEAAGAAKLNPFNQPRVQVQQPTQASPFATFARKIDKAIATTMANPKLAATTKNQMIAGLQADKVRNAKQFYGNDPTAINFLNESAPERDAITSAIQAGDNVAAREILQRSRNPLTGAPNPVYAEAYSQALQLKVKQDQQEAGYKRLETLFRALDNESLPPATKEKLQRQADVLQDQLFQLDQVEVAEDATQANSLIPAY
jgi:hypothetical protein